ncbi:hypothetical protein CURT_1663 [Campylobacter ureolyticus]|uniref:Uncharacterized protein n=2 Tax=Campylobacter ureolyticus TaxID=827 RepID=A0AAE7JQ88_9BACT|nr:hypothetical protein CURT_1663 [Campylobacter ureolyticus]
MIHNKYLNKNIPKDIFADILSISESFLIGNISEILFKKNNKLQPYYSLGFNPKERYDILAYCIFKFMMKNLKVSILIIRRYDEKFL